MQERCDITLLPLFVDFIQCPLPAKNLKKILDKTQSKIKYLVNNSRYELKKKTKVW